VAETFDLFRYFSHLRRRLLFLLVVCGTALFLSLGASLLLPRRYTATARIMIDPPAGSDQRMLINPVYMESLKTYEVLATGDHLFLQAIDHFRLPHPKPIDQLKHSVLKVTIPRNTRILEIAATLPDAPTAQALALYLAQQVVELSRLSTRETERDLIANAEKGLDDARTKMQNAERAWAELESAPVNQTATRSMQIDVAQTQRDAARGNFEAAQRRLQEARLGAGYRGERMTIIDPGVVPERPSSPNIPLNLVIALLISLVAALFYLALDFNYGSRNGFSLAEWERYREPRRAG
jgi:uncharacterized protein involved in exopolysaccharide biosynthesis